jgi:putative NADH-flavin reductase
MRLLIFGSTGSLGSRITREALRRGHAVTAVVRDPSKQVEPGIEVEVGDVTDPTSVARLAPGHDVVISAVGGVRAGDPGLVVRAARALLVGMRRTDGARLAVVGGAGSLEVAPGRQLVDSPDFPEAWKLGSLAQRDALAVYRSEGGQVDWTYLSPADVIEPGERTGRYETGLDQLVVDESGVSRISIEDYAVAFVDELESPKHRRQRFTVGYGSSG